MSVPIGGDQTRFPSLEVLTGGLRAVLADGVNGTTAGGMIEVSKRTPNEYPTCCPSEIVGCVCPGGRELGLLIKYGPSVRREGGHRLGARYEAAVYREVVHRAPMASAKYYGEYEEPGARRTWLIIEHISGGVHVSRGWPQEHAMAAAAAWIGHFHASNERQAPRLGAVLNRYNARYCRLWALRTLRFERGSQARWLDPLVKGFEEAVAVLAGVPHTIIHGDYYADNALYCRGRIYAIDWEHAGVGAGEIDLACLTLGWPEEMIQQCMRAYCAARWPGGAPRAFSRRFNAAQLYVLFRLLGEAPEWPDASYRAWRLDLLRVAGARMGLI
ncbi:MAG TPA: phosphotransferase [Vicinamibacterales bacterium]|nr:phosphotransferase [Vicinamibacterales bacterium]